jgi:hypothetical protein
VPRLCPVSPKTPSRGSDAATFEFKNWSGARDLNPGPHGPEPCALPNCASPRRENDSIGATARDADNATALILEGAVLRQEMGGGPVMNRTSVGGEVLSYLAQAAFFLSLSAFSAAAESLRATPSFRACLAAKHAAVGGVLA